MSGPIFTKTPKYIPRYLTRSINTSMGKGLTSILPYLNSYSLCFPKTIRRGYRTAYLYTDVDQGNNAIRSYYSLPEKEQQSLISIVKDSTALESNSGNFEDFKAPITKSGQNPAPHTHENIPENTQQIWGALAPAQLKRLKADIPENDFASLNKDPQKTPTVTQYFDINRVNEPHGFDSPLQMILDNNSVTRIEKNAEYAKTFKDILANKPGKLTVLHQLFHNVLGVLTPRMVAAKDPKFKQGKTEENAIYENRIEKYLEGIFGEDRVKKQEKSKEEGGNRFRIIGCISQHSSIIITVNIGTKSAPKWVQYGYETGTPQDAITPDGTIYSIKNQRKGPRSSTSRIMSNKQPKDPSELKVVKDPNVVQMENLYSDVVFNTDFKSRGTPSVTFTVDAPYAGNALLNMLMLTGKGFSDMLATAPYEAHGPLPGQRTSCTVLIPQIFNDAGVDIRQIFAGYQFRPWDATDDAQYEHYGNIFDGLVMALKAKDETGSVEKFNEITPRAWSKDTMQELFASFTATHLYLQMMEEIKYAALTSDKTDHQLMADVTKMKEDIYMTPHAMDEYSPITCALYKLFKEHPDFPALEQFDQDSVADMLRTALNNVQERTKLYEKLAKETGADSALLKHLKGRYDLIDDLISTLPAVKAPPTK